MRVLQSWFAVCTAFIVQTAAFSQQAHTAAEVIAALSASSSAPVLVKLDVPLTRQLSSSDHAEYLSRVQDSILASLTQEDFKPGYRYQAVPAVSGLLFRSGLEKLVANPYVLSIELDLPGQGGLLESVPAIQADVVHDMGVTGKGVVVGVLDSGVNMSHDDLADDIVHQFHFLNQGSDVGSGAQDGHGHGSNVTGIITSDGNLAPIGVAPDAEIVAIRVLDSNNSGWVSDWIAGIDYIVANNSSLGVRIINMSLVTNAQFAGDDCDREQAAFAAAAAAARDAGILIFASSGNRGSTETMTAPACLSDVVAVGAVYDSDLGREPNNGTYRTLFGSFWPDCADETTSLTQLACFTSRTSSLELVAPGALITSTGLASNTSTFRGTSQASPQAAGVAALLLELDGNLTREDIRQTLKTTSVHVADPVTGASYPLLNAREAVALVTDINELPGTALSTFELAQSYPNPLQKRLAARAQTTISYRLKESETVELTLYDVRGRTVRQLVKEFKTPGEYRISVSGINLPDGVYFYRLRVGSLTQTRKMMILE